MNQKQIEFAAAMTITRQDKIDWWLSLTHPIHDIYLEKYYPEFEGAYGDLKISQIVHMYNSEKIYEEQMVKILEGKAPVPDLEDFRCDECGGRHEECNC